MSFAPASLSATDQRRERKGQLSPLDRAVRATYCLLGVLLVGYWISVVVRGGTYSVALDGWFVASLEIAAASLCVFAAIARRSGRAMAAALGVGLLFWAVGDCVLTVESIGGHTPPVPSLADFFYLGFYPMAYIAVLSFMRSHFRRLPGPSWLDGAVAGLGAAALCAAFAFHSIVHAAGTGTWGTAVNVAFPIGDLLLLGLVAGGSVLLAGSRRAVWLLLAAGLSIVVVGDTINLFSSSLADSRPGTIINDVAWPTATLLMSMAPWQRAHPRDILSRGAESGFLLPGVAVAGALGIAFIGTTRHMTAVALGLAAATLVLAGARLATSARALRTLSAERHQQSMTDELTGLHNRRYLSGLLEDYYAERDGFGQTESDLAFLFVDLDHFKEINDSFGHPAGDELLRQLGPRFQSCLRSSDVMVRLGGDEFVVLLFGANAAYVAEVAERLSACLEQPFAFHSVKARVGASIGIAMASEAGDPSELMWSADVAMFRAKQSGTGFATYGQDLDGSNRLDLADELRLAIEKNQLELHYQPQMDFRTGAIVSVEALLRWVHPERGIIPPLHFIPLAEEAGLMRPLTEFVVQQAMAQAATWRGAGCPMPVSVNVSATDLLRPGFADMVRGALASHQLPGDTLVIEITETCVIDNVTLSHAVVDDLRSSGIVVSIDDFGAGATSLSYLSSLGVGELKLDRSFITDLSGPGRRRELELVRATIELGHAMGLRVVAEGIEDKETLDLLGELGCDLAQGYYISRPKPAQDLVFRQTETPAQTELVG